MLLGNLLFFDSTVDGGAVVPPYVFIISALLIDSTGWVDSACSACRRLCSSVDEELEEWRGGGGS